MKKSNPEDVRARRVTALRVSIATLTEILNEIVPPAAAAHEEPVDTIGEALRAVQAHFEGEDDPAFADLCDLVNRAAEEHAAKPDRTPQLDMAKARIARLTAELAARAPADTPSVREALASICHGASLGIEAAALADIARKALDASAPADASLEARAEIEDAIGRVLAADPNAPPPAPWDAFYRAVCRLLAKLAQHRAAADASRPGLTEEQADPDPDARTFSGELLPGEHLKLHGPRSPYANEGCQCRVCSACDCHACVRAPHGEAGSAPVDPPTPDRPTGLASAMHAAQQRPNVPCKGPLLSPAERADPSFADALLVVEDRHREAAAVHPTAAPDPRASPHAGDPDRFEYDDALDVLPPRTNHPDGAFDRTSLADVVAASAREPHADVVLHALHVSGGAAAVASLDEPAVLGGRGYLSTGDRFRDQLAGDRHVEAGGCKDPACEWCDNDAPAPRFPREP